MLQVGIKSEVILTNITPPPLALPALIPI
jgi:hypothetical protein